MKVSVVSGQYDVLASGVAMTAKDSPLDVYLNNDLGNRIYHLRFRFINDLQNKDSLVRSTSIDNGSGIDFELINFNNCLGRGVVTPMAIATRNGLDALFLTFSVNSFTGVATKQIFYTIYTMAGR